MALTLFLFKVADLNVLKNNPVVSDDSHLQAAQLISDNHGILLSAKILFRGNSLATSCSSRHRSGRSMSSH